MVEVGAHDGGTSRDKVAGDSKPPSCDDEHVTRFIDLNADLGESTERWDTGEDEALLAIVTSANVCTGAYAGDDELILATCAATVRLGVRLGAQVGYPDREGFGRRPMEFEPAKLATEIRRQLRHLTVLAAQIGADIAYVKPHGALYHRIIQDPAQAQAVRDAAGRLPLMGLAGTLPAGLPPDIAEGFADRAYSGPTVLLPRSEPGALLTDPDAAGAQAVRLMEAGVHSVCVHSDSPGALNLARSVRAALEAAGAEVGYR